MGRHLIHESAVMGDEDQLVFPLQEKALEPAKGEDIEVVGGFVQQKQIRLGNENGCQVEPNLETAGKFQGIALEIACCKSEPLKDRFGSVGLIPPVLGRFETPAGLLKNGVCREADMLREMTDGVMPGESDFPRVRTFIATDHPEEGRFAMTVPSYQSDPFPPVNRKGDLAEKHLPSIGFI